MVEPVQDDVARAAQLGGIVADAGRLARRADEAAIRLRVLVVVVRPDRHHLDARDQIVGTVVEALEERKGAVEFAARQQGLGNHDPLVGRSAEHGVAYQIRPAAVLQQGADGIAAARGTDESDLAAARGLQDLQHEARQLLHLVLGRGPQRLRLRIVAAGVGIDEVDGEELVALVAVGLETPEIVDPERARIAVAVHEDDRRRPHLGLRTARHRLAERLAGKGKRRRQHGSAAEQRAAGRAFLRGPQPLAHHSP